MALQLKVVESFVGVVDSRERDGQVPGMDPNCTEETSDSQAMDPHFPDPRPCHAEPVIESLHGQM